MIAHPATEKRRAVSESRVIAHMRARVGLSDHHGGMFENFANRFCVALGIGMNEARFKIFFER